MRFARGRSTRRVVEVMPVLCLVGCPGPVGSASTGGSSDLCDVPGAICTVAGTGLSLFDGDGKLALETSFYYPLDVEFDAQGRPLILDWNNLRVRRLNQDGSIETIMGTDFEGFPGDGALAVETPLHHPSDIEMDDRGRLYVAGDHVPVVFRLDTDDRVYLVAGTQEYGYDGDGGPALEAKLTTPFGVLPTADGGFYLSDTDVNVVRYVDPSGIIHTVVGNGIRGYSGDGGPATEAQLDHPSRLRLDHVGNLYVCDTRNNVVRRVDADGIITTFAGTGESGYSVDGGPATLARFAQPYDARFSPSGDLYIADSGNNVIRKVDRSGIVTTVVGVGEAGFDGDGGDATDCLLDLPSSVTFDASGGLWISDTYNQRVRRVAGFLSFHE